MKVNSHVKMTQFCLIDLTRMISTGDVQLKMKYVINGGERRKFIFFYLHN